MKTLHLTLKMISEDYSHLDDHTRQTTLLLQCILQSTHAVFLLYVCLSEEYVHVLFDLSGLSSSSLVCLLCKSLVELITHLHWHAVSNQSQFGDIFLHEGVIFLVYKKVTVEYDGDKTTSYNYMFIHIFIYNLHKSFRQLCKKWYYLISINVPWSQRFAFAAKREERKKWWEKTSGCGWCESHYHATIAVNQHHEID